MSIRSLYRKLMFADVKKIVVLARKKILQVEDMPALPQNYDPRHLPFDENSLDLSNAKAFIWSLFKAGKRFLIPALSLYLVSAFLGLTKPVLVNAFIATISHGLNDKAALIKALYLAVSLGLVSFLATICLQHYFLRNLGCYQIFTNAINRLIFKHSLMLTQKSRNETQLGDVVNHMSSDSDYVSDIGMIFGELVISLVTIFGVCALLFYYLGTTAFLSIGLLLLLIPLTKKIASSFSKLDEELMKHRDQRVTLMSQAMNGIRVVKYFAWEKSVKKEVGEVRQKELHSRKQLAKSEALATLSYTAVSTLVLFASLAFHIWRGHLLSPELVFTCITLFALLEEPFGHLSEVISRIASTFVGADRICKFLKRDRLNDVLSGDYSESELPGIEIAGLSVQYDKKAELALQDIHLNILPGESVAFVGSVGSGKSTLLQALLKEISFHQGNISFLDIRRKTVVPRIAYVPQEAFIMNGSLKENVLFGEREDATLLQTALQSSCLDADLPQLPAGLFTEIGERGVNLSGGQKQRVSLARAVMSAPNLVLLDDPLSAVDTRTEEQLIERLLFGVWRGITRVVVTHRLTHLAHFDKVIYLSKGKIIAQGTLQELLANSKEFKEFFADSAHTESSQGSLQVAKEAQPMNASAQIPVSVAESRVTEDEDRAIGAVKGGVYLDYIKALGGDKASMRLWMWPMLLASTIIVSGFPLLQKTWLALSSNLQNGKVVANDGMIHHLGSQPMPSILVYGVIGLLTLAGVFVNKMLWLNRGMAAGRDMHDHMLNAILRAPIRFFDSTPIGRILQRFSRDVEAVDIQLQWSFETTVRCLINIATALVLILGVLPLMLVVVIPVLFFYYKLQRDYRIPAREAKRLDSISRSPRFAHFKETLQGLVVIRGFNKTNLFLDGFYDRLAHSQRMFYGHYMLNRWFSSRIPVLGGLIASTTGIGVVVYSYYGLISPGVAGLVTIYALTLWESLNWAVRIFSEVEARMTSVERIRFYSNLEAEKDIFLAPEANTEQNWPSKGEVVFDRVVARYAAHLPPVLKGISFRIPAGARVGIIGRTGSGKSTLLQALFRAMELESGEIRIDGVNIASVKLEKLRRNLAIIPQDPTLFLGTLRSNLDRYQEHTEEEIWNALKKARLESLVKGMENGLLSPVLENGSNLSQGQRQLLCLARALLLDAKVIVMDEATASVDVQTDTLVQEVVRESCANITMIIIAHRLGTVADCDLIFEVREGKLHRTLDLKKQEKLATVIQ